MKKGAVAPLPTTVKELFEGLPDGLVGKEDFEGVSISTNQVALNYNDTILLALEVIATRNNVEAHIITLPQGHASPFYAAFRVKQKNAPGTALALWGYVPCLENAQRELEKFNRVYQARQRQEILDILES